MKPRYAILNDDHSLSYTDNYMSWTHKFQDSEKRIVKQETVNGMKVSTVFLGVNHNYSEGAPHWFETMVFLKGTFSETYCERCETWDEALKMHEVAVEWAKVNSK